MADFYADMVDTESSRFYSLCFPLEGERIHQHNPIRDLAAAWDASKIVLYLKEYGDDSIPQSESLQQAINTTVSYYQAYIIPIRNNQQHLTMLDSKVLEEAPNIAHSALMILASLGTLKLPFLQTKFAHQYPWIDGLVQGILSMQREDGAFFITFGKDQAESNVYQGIEFYPGEAMVALTEVYDFSSTYADIIVENSKRQNILLAMEQAFEFYSSYYHQHNTDTNYNIWQIQAFSRFFQILNGKGNQAKAELVGTYVVELCQEVVNSKAWKYELARGQSFYPNLNTVEIACGLDALSDGIDVARSLQSDILELLEMRAQNAVDFLEWAQDQLPADATVGKGGLGYGGTLVLEQRLDVTGHAISALTKL